MKMDEDGADIDWVDDADGPVKVMFLSSKNMKDIVRTSSCLNGDHFRGRKGTIQAGGILLLKFDNEQD